MSNLDVQKALINHGLLDPPADGAWGPQSAAALRYFQKQHGMPVTGIPDTATMTALLVAPVPLKLGSDLASRVIREMLRNNFFISRAEKAYNIVYLEGANKDGTPNADEFNVWNDRRLLIEIPDDTPKIVGNWLATTEPGSTYTYHPLNPGGAFRIKFGQYKAWTFGKHGKTQYPALVQCGVISGYRDKNEDGARTGDLLVTGDDFEVNQHHGWDMEFVNNASAGCLVVQAIEDHEDFMEILRGDRRYRVNPNYVWYTTILAGDVLP